MSIKKKYDVKPIKSFETYDWLMHKHYARRIPSISYAFGLYDNYGAMQGVCTFGTPASSTLLNGVCGTDSAKYVVELNRLVINDNQIKNLASYFVSKCIAMLSKPKIIVSYADTEQGHIGKVYQSCNFIYTGLSSKFIDPKVKGLEHQHHATYANGMTNEELKNKYGDSLYFVERSRKHRYIYFSGTKKQVSNFLKNLSYKTQPYPKGESKRYDASYTPQTQTTLF
jgi:hypothetical protein